MKKTDRNHPYSEKAYKGMKKQNYSSINPKRITEMFHPPSQISFKNKPKTVLEEVEKTKSINYRKS